MIAARPPRPALAAERVLRLVALGLGVAGLWVRLAAFGRHGFWTDEAYVALTTRTTSWIDFWHATGPTPIAWAALLPLVAGGRPPEIWLRLVPLAFGLGTLWIAWRLGKRVASSALGGVLAVAAVAFDPVGVTYAKALKQYTAEAFFALLAFDRLSVALRTPSTRAIAELALSLAAGIAFSNAQLFVAPPILAVLVLATALRGDAPALGRALAASSLVGLWSGAWYLTVMAPHLPPVLQTGFAPDFVPRHDLRTAARFVWTVIDARLAAILGSVEWKIALAALVALGAGDARLRALGVALGLLVVEMVAASLAGLVPFATPRIQLFAFTVAAAVLAAALARALVVAGTGRLGRTVATLLVIGLVVHGARTHPWAALRTPPRVEDLGPLVAEVESERTPDDVVLVYGRSRYLWAYYARATPRLQPVPKNAVGYVPITDDPRVRIIDVATAEAVATRAFADAPVVWFVGSRLGGEAAVFEHVLRNHGIVSARRDREDAILLRLERRPS